MMILYVIISEGINIALHCLLSQRMFWKSRLILHQRMLTYPSKEKLPVAHDGCHSFLGVHVGGYVSAFRVSMPAEM